MNFWIGVVLIAIGLLISIALHEVGHLLPAKKFGVRVPQYFVGFGPTLWSRTKGETEYGIKAIPLGGFVRMIGMFPPAKDSAASSEAQEEARLRRRGLLGWAHSVTEDARAASMQELEPGDEKRAFYQLSTPKKLAVMFGGPFVNLILSALLFAIMVGGIGLPVATNAVATVAQCVPSAPGAACTADDEVAPSVVAGLQPGDAIVSWGGVAVSDWTELTAAIADGGTSPLEVVVEREGVEQTLTVTPAIAERTVVAEDGTSSLREVPYVGVTASVVNERQSLTQVPGIVWQQFTGTAAVVLTLPQRLASIAQSLFGNAERDPSVIGIIGIGRVAGDVNEAAADDGIATQALWMLSILASLNMALFVFNLIPLPPLDGGHIAGALYEGARRQIARWRNRPNPGYADTARLMPLTYVVFFAFLGMGLLLAVADIVKPVTFT